MQLIRKLFERFRALEPSFIALFGRSLSSKFFSISLVTIIKVINHFNPLYKNKQNFIQKILPFIEAFSSFNQIPLRNFSQWLFLIFNSYVCKIIKWKLTLYLLLRPVKTLSHLKITLDIKVKQFIFLISISRNI